MAAGHDLAISLNDDTVRLLEARAEDVGLSSSEFLSEVVAALAEYWERGEALDLSFEIRERTRNAGARKRRGWARDDLYDERFKRFERHD